MAYSKVVIWPAPFDTQKLPAGRYGMKYTYVECDIPQFEFSRELWELSNVFIGFGENQEETVFYTSTYYRKATLKAFANGIEIPALEDTKRKKRVVKLKTADIQNKDIYFKYVPDEFGVGLKVKEVLRASSLPALKVKIEQELLREPGVLGVSTQLSLANGILVIKANVRTANGNTETIIEAR
jgi:hypothetical protein